MSDSIDLERSSTNSLHCGSDYKEVHCVQQQSIAKLSRSDLEDLYYQLHDENTEVKKKFNNLDSKYKVMATRVMRLSRDHKCVESINREEDQRQLQQLKQNEALLQAKLTVLRGQLASHTRLHSAALSKMQRPRSHRCSRSCHRGCCAGDNESFLEVNVPASSSRGASQQGAQQGGGAVHIQNNNCELEKANSALREEVVLLQEKISMLQKDMLHSSELSQNKIQELETELEKYIAQETTENVELIKARRMIKHQEATTISLQQEHQLVQRELQACKAALSLAAKDQDELCSTLMRERQRSTDLQQEIVKLSQNCSSMREIEEQLNDAKKENAVLKEHSNRLLQLSTGFVDTRSSPRGDSPQKQHIPSNPNNQDLSAISEENSVIELKIKSLKQQQSHLQQELKETQSEISALRQKILDAKEERNNLREEHIQIQNECCKLQTELSEPNENRKRLNQQLAEARTECAHLTDELSKYRSELEQQQQVRHDFHIAMQERRVSSLVRERNGLDRGCFPQQLAASGASVVNQTYLYTPQSQSAGHASHFLAPFQSHPHSHPSTPRPRPRGLGVGVGDACLALLEQTAIKPSSAFPGALASHGSLQERFLELCIPAGSASSPPAAGPPAQSVPAAPVAEPVAPTPTSDDIVAAQRQTQFPLKARVGTQPQQISGQNDTQRELDKCREMLRVQFNLNSIYKKEVASLNNIVQSLTSGTQDANK
ncbi:hypothetical protein ONE63_005521 [Megalurothrips usitatus]|uniref:Uncharacterized protein n=1 Tax=Megalurothrips usitatus TaxID=439358 RepID=A0AAV7XVR0_9NEOP|nr:hypothetical protein ONE63_005521 [Megalurothrips usitatus]